jgi:hypothetical protein
LAFLAQHNAVTTKPKRKPSAYNRFMADADLRASLKEANPDYSPKEMMSALAKKWKTLSPDEKAAYQPDPSTAVQAAPVIKKKRAPSAYNRFMADTEQRATLKEANPDYSPKEMMSALAKKWKTLSTDAKAAYQPAVSPTASTPPKKKRPPSAYNRFMADKERRETIKNAHPESSPREIMSLMAAQWKLLSDDDKIPYQPPSAALA